MERIDRIEKAIEELVASQKKTDAQLAELSESHKMVDIKFTELAESQKEMRKSMGIQSAELAESQKEMRKSMGIQSAELAESQKEMQCQLGGIGNTNGEFAENFFFSSLSNKMQLGGIKFDYIERNVKSRIRNLTDEFDIVLYNGDSVGLLEIKNTVKAANVTQLLQTKLQNFRTLNPEYASAKIYLGIGGFSFENESVKASAKAAGIIVLEVQGDHFEADVANMRAF
jgi:hypothetical protein